MIGRHVRNGRQAGRSACLLIPALVAFCAMPATAQTQERPSAAAQSYSAEYFAPFNPVTAEDMIRRVQYIAMQNRTSPDQIVKSLQKGDGIDSLRHSILLGKALDVLVEHATVAYEGTAGVEDETPQA